MEEISQSAYALLQAIKDAMQKIRYDDLVVQAEKLRKQSEQKDFWADNQAATKTMKQLGDIQTRTDRWFNLQVEVAEVYEMAKTGDNKLKDELADQLIKNQRTFDKYKQELMFGGLYDGRPAIVSIHAGAGGTDAQDWAQMLMRMYVRYAEKQDFEVKTVDQSDGEEAGIKSVTFEVAGPFAYGKLKSEHGVHRLVRLSPFNSDNLRQTSFAKVEVMPKIDSPDAVQIDEKDIKIDVYRSGGKGGQSVNTTDSAVRVTHVPTGITVAIQNERSQLQNKETALTILRSKLAQLQLEQHADDLRELKGPNEQAAWGNQIRSYVLHPYKQVKDLRTRYESSDPEAVLDGGLEDFITAYLERNISDEK